MPDESIQCILGRMEEQLFALKEDIKELKDEQKGVVDYITKQKIGFRMVISAFVAIGTLTLTFKEELVNLTFGKHP